MSRVNLDGDKWLEYPSLARETNARMTAEGILVASLDDSGKLNPMTIGWGVFGSIWGRPIFTVLVRPSRYTYDCVEGTEDFTVNVPPLDRKDIADVCGTRSGRDCNKMSELRLTPLASQFVKTPGIAECPIVFECQVVHHNDLIPANLTKDITNTFYPQGDFHRVYFGQIMNVSVTPDRVSG